MGGNKRVNYKLHKAQKAYEKYQNHIIIKKENLIESIILKFHTTIHNMIL